jgi:hypothetical protein
MNAKEKEKFYDEKIAPELVKLALACRDNGLTFLAGVEWSPGEIGKTFAGPGKHSEAMSRAAASLEGSFGVGAMAVTIKRET